MCEFCGCGRGSRRAVKALLPVTLGAIPVRIETTAKETGTPGKPRPGLRGGQLRRATPGQ